MTRSQRFAIFAATTIVATFSAFPQPTLVAVAGQPTGSSGSDYLYDVNTTTGAFTNPRPVGDYWAVAATAGGTLYGVDSTTKALATINPSTGAATVIPGGTPGMTIEGDLAIDPTSGLLYGVDSLGALFVINTSNAARTLIGTIQSGVNLDISAIAFDSSGRLYAADTMAGPNGKLLEIDKNTAGIIRSVPFNPSPGGSVAGMAFHPLTGKLYMAADGSSNRLSTVDPLTGVVTLIANITNPPLVGIYALTFLPPPTVSGSPCNTCLPPPEGGVLWLPFDEATTAAPSSNVFGADGVHTGGTMGPGVVGGSACMNGVNGYVTVPSYVLFTNPFSIDAWIIRAATAGTIFDKRTGAGTSSVRGVRFHVLAGGALGLELGNGGLPVQTQSTSGTTVPADGVFHHVAVTVVRGSATGGAMYIDGTRVYTFSTVAPVGGGLNAGSPSRIGADSQTPTNVFNGCIDELEIHNRVLDATEISAIYRSGRNGKCRVFAISPFPLAMCGAHTAVQHHKVCNAGLLPQTFTYSFSTQAPLGSCNVPGPSAFTPLSGGPVTIAPGQCVDVPVTITAPWTWPPSTISGCYQMFAVGSWGTAETTGVVTNACNNISQ